MNILVGRRLMGIKIAEDNGALLFQTNEGDVIAECDADCCSYTWVEHVELPALGFPAVVLSADDVDMPDLGDMPERDVVSYYGFKIVTDKGDILIDYRNDSNGYYGGSLTWPEDRASHYGGVWGQNNSNHVWKEIER